MNQLLACERCGASISDTAPVCPMCLEKTGPESAIASKISVAAGGTLAIVALGPAAIATALVTSPFEWDMNRQLKRLAGDLQAIDSFDVTEGIRYFVNQSSFVPVLTSLGSAVPYPEISRSDLHDARIDEDASRDGGLFLQERVVLRVDYFNANRKKRNVAERYVFKGNQARPLASYACVKFLEYRNAR